MSKNTTTRTEKQQPFRDFLLELLDGNRELIKQDFQALEPMQRILIMEKLLPYLLPRNVSARDVEGAVFTRQDVTTKHIFDSELERTELKRWYDTE